MGMSVLQYMGQTMDTQARDFGTTGWMYVYVLLSHGLIRTERKK